MIDLLKNKIKMIVLIFMLIFVSSGIGVFATYNYLASDVKYTDDKSVADALNELYSFREFKTYNMLEKTTITGDGYNLKKLTLKNNENDKIMYLNLEADVKIQDRNDTYNIDLRDFNINQILDYKIYNYTKSGDFRISSSNFTKDSVSIKCDSNWGASEKYNYNYVIIFIYQ